MSFPNHTNFLSQGAIWTLNQSHHTTAGSHRDVSNVETFLTGWQKGSSSMGNTFVYDLMVLELKPWQLQYQIGSS